MIKSSPQTLLQALCVNPVAVLMSVAYWVISSYKTVRSYIRDHRQFSGLISSWLWQRLITVLINNRLHSTLSCMDKRKGRTILNWCIIYHSPMLIWVLEVRLISKCGAFQIYKHGLIMINLIDQITHLFNKAATHSNWYTLIIIWLKSASLGSWDTRLTGQILNVMCVVDCLMSIRVKSCLNHYNGTRRTVRSINT